MLQRHPPEWVRRSQARKLKKGIRGVQGMSLQGVMISHRSILYCIAGQVRMLKQGEAPLEQPTISDTFLSWLPLCHVMVRSWEKPCPYQGNWLRVALLASCRMASCQWQLQGHKYAEVSEQISRVILVITLKECWSIFMSFVWPPG